MEKRERARRIMHPVYGERSGRCPWYPFSGGYIEKLHSLKSAPWNAFGRPCENLPEHSQADVLVIMTRRVTGIMMRTGVRCRMQCQKIASKNGTSTGKRSKCSIKQTEFDSQNVLITHPKVHLAQKREPKKWKQLAHNKQRNTRFV